MFLYWIVSTILALINSERIFETSGGNFIAVVGPNKLNYSEAQEYCQTNYGTALARVTSQSQNDELFSIRLHLWIDGNDLEEEGEWKFSNGELFWSSQSGLVQGFYENWGPSEPNNSAGREHCLMLAGNDADWLDQLCEVKLDFACDKVSYDVPEVEPLTCPAGSVQVGEINADIFGCGLTSCDDRYDYEDVDACEEGCRENSLCKAFTWAPLGGDRNHVNETVCTFYSSSAPTSTWGPNQIFCRSVKCPGNSKQVGGVNADIFGCGLSACNQRYNHADIDACEEGCRANSLCKAFTWAPLGGDQNHVEEKVCTFYAEDAPTSSWGPNQIFCNAEKPLTCPVGSIQVGEINADILGCGLTSCEERYNYADIDACESACRSNFKCKAFTWAPLGGNRNHVNEKVCTLYEGNTPTGTWGPTQIFCRSVKCPAGSVQVGEVNADIAGCGLTFCEDRYKYENIEDCQDGCRLNSNCASFTWAPLGGDRDHVNEKVCTFYNTNTPNRQWAPNQVMCRSVKCPAGSTQVGPVNSDIGGCGLQACNQRYTSQNIVACQNNCVADSRCKAFTWAPLSGDKFHLNERVCTLYDSDTPNRLWEPNQIMCKQDQNEETNLSAAS